MDALFQLIVFLVLLTLGYVFGRRAESSHYKSIFEREEQLRHIVVTTDRIPPPEYLKHDSTLVMGSVVISVDYFKVVAAGLRSLVGGRIQAYETLLDRARREAVLRMQEHASDIGAAAIINTKFETSSVSGSAGNGIGSMEVLAYGTAMIPKR